MGRTLLHEHWDWGNNDRHAKIFYVMDIQDHYEVDFYEGGVLKESRQMITDGEPHSERYAEDAAENWCLGYIP